MGEKDDLFTGSLPGLYNDQIAERIGFHGKLRAAALKLSGDEFTHPRFIPRDSPQLTKGTGPLCQMLHDNPSSMVLASRRAVCSRSQRAAISPAVCINRSGIERSPVRTPPRETAMKSASVPVREPMISV